MTVEGDVYATFLTNDRYLPGAMVLAHALRDGGYRNGIWVPGTSKKLAVLVAEGRLRPTTLDELKTLYDYVIPVPVITGTAPKNLQLLGRLELNETLTKIHLWKQTQFNKILYLDADVLPLAPPDEVFDIDADFAASPDIGWPDCFNSGVMLLRPNQETYESLLKLVTSGQTFDGADQGLLNIHFEGRWHRLPFTYNCTPSASYQYTPAYRYYGSKVSMVHFIGESKPWNSRVQYSHAAGPFAEHLQTWWKVWDKHYVPKVQENASTSFIPYEPVHAYQQTSSVQGPSTNFTQAAEPVHWSPPHSGSTERVDSEGRSFTPTPHHVQQEDRPPTPKPIVTEPEQKPSRTETVQPAVQLVEEVSRPEVASIVTEDSPAAKSIAPSLSHQEQSSTVSLPPFEEYPSYQPSFMVAGTVYVHRGDEPYPEDIKPDEEVYVPSPTYVEPFTAPHYEWDPARSPPPVNSIPEGSNMPYINYRNEWDSILQSTSGKTGSQSESATKTKAPTPEEAQAAQSPTIKPVFPWEYRALKPTRVFLDPPNYELPGSRVERIHSPESEEGTGSDDEDETASFEELESEEGVSEPEETVSESEEAVSESEEAVSESEEDVSDSESKTEGSQWGYGINQWDTIPGISTYVSTFLGHSIYFNPDSMSSTQQNFIDSYYDDERPPIPLASNRRRSRLEEKFPSAPGITPPDQWDPEAKLNDLCQLPVSFLERQAKKQQISSGGEAEQWATQYERAPEWMFDTVPTTTTNLEENSRLETQAFYEY
ncbi:nucleotide-diphospho-sugar transferase [Kalaharituber pfeilii]|nr:nucleotide-diphospho-sugar transferase [Kalaharituber pfeilii]